MCKIFFHYMDSGYVRETSLGSAQIPRRADVIEVRRPDGAIRKYAVADIVWTFTDDLIRDPGVVVYLDSIPTRGVSRGAHYSD